MNDMQLVCIWITELVPLMATLFSMIYGLKHFFKKGKPLCLQSITMAMASHLLGSIYHLCQTLTSDVLVEGFTPAYLGRIGFFLFVITASYGQLDRIVDDGSAQMRPARWIALIAPVCAILLYILHQSVGHIQKQRKNRGNQSNQSGGTHFSRTVIHNSVELTVTRCNDKQEKTDASKISRRESLHESFCCKCLAQMINTA